MLRHVLFDLDLFKNESDRDSSQKRVLVLLEALTLINQFYLAENPDTPLIYQSGIEYKLPLQFEDPTASPLYQYLKNSGAPKDAMDEYKFMAGATGGEVFRDIPRIIKNGGGDCDNVAAWRAAEIRHHLGVAAKPFITWRKRPDGGTTYHVLVIWPDGSSEDPSLLLNMPEQTPGDRQKEVDKLAERATEMMADMQAPKAKQIASAVVKQAQLEAVIGLLLRGAR
jgi:hypothetical protein